jgi:hypothetical protein
LAREATNGSCLGPACSGMLRCKVASMTAVPKM